MLSLIAFSEQNITDIVAWAGDIVGGLMPLLIVILGIAIGAFVVKVILNLRG